MRQTERPAAAGDRPDNDSQRKQTTLQSSATEIISHVKISEVYCALGGGDLHHGRGCAFWRGGDGFNVALNDSKGAWFDHANGEGGGVLDLVQKVHGVPKSDALRWLADFAGVALEDRPLTPQERSRFAQERAAFERDLEAAHYWRRTAIVLYEATADLLKTALFDPTAEPIDTRELASIERALSRLRTAGDALLVAEYREWQADQPRMTAGMVWAARRREEIERRALARFVVELASGVGE